MADNDYKVPDSILRQQKQQKADQAKFQKQTAEQLGKQSKLISEISKANTTLREELTKADSTTFNASEADKLSRLQTEVDQLEMNIEYERMRKSDVQGKHAMCRVDLLSTRKGMGGVTIATDNAAAVEKQVTVLENRLDQALVKFNEALSNNKNLRAQIDSLREERQVFQRIYKKLEQELYQRKKEMADKIEQANVDYEERDQLKQQLEKEKIKAEDSRRECQEGFLQMDKVLEELKATAQEQKRLQIAQMTLSQPAAGATGRNVTSGPRSGRHANDSPLSNNNTTNGKNLNATNNGAAKLSSRNGGLDSRGGDSAYVEDEEADLQSVVDDLKATTGHQDLRLLLDNFIKSEELNFSTYKYINSLDSQREDLEKEIAELQQELSDAKEDAERRKVIKDLENELATTQSQQEALNAQTKQNQQTIEQACDIVQQMFKASGCDERAATAQFGTNQVSKLNLNGFLGFVEKRATALLHTYNNRGATSPTRRVTDRQDGSDDDNDDAKAASGGALVTSQPDAMSSFIGIGPSKPDPLGDATQRVKGEVLPQANAGEGVDDAKDEGILSYDVMRQRVAARMRQRTDKAKGKSSKGKR
eukprot:GILI01006622.1.p1 GENE.GILI01006622.1~~GILI01006622.1.p1  ORF type:complete len:592 (-),score=233.69 GILI01006622.1:135-1910(-)